MSVSPTLAINQITSERILNGKETYKLGFGQSPFPVPNILINKLKESAHIKDYLSTQGLEELRDAIAAYHSRKTGLPISGDQVVVGPGSKELIFLTQLTLGRELILPSPSWVSYAPQSKLLNKPVHWIDTRYEDDWKMTAGKLDAFLKDRPISAYFLILNYPNNPGGTTYNNNELQDLVDVARKYDLIIIADEIYSEFDFDGTHSSIYQYYPEGSILCNGLSKWCGAGGWRLGYMVFPKALDKLKLKVIQAGSETYSCASAPIQYASVEAFKDHPEIREYTKNGNFILKHIARYIFDNLDESKIKMRLPQGGFYGFLLFNKVYFGDNTSADLCTRLLNETGVALLPGSAFGRDPYELSARMAFVDFDGRLIYNEEIIKNSDVQSLYLEIPNIKKAVQRLNNFNSIN